MSTFTPRFRGTTIQDFLGEAQAADLDNRQLAMRGLPSWHQRSLQMGNANLGQINQAAHLWGMAGQTPAPQNPRSAPPPQRGQVSTWQRYNSLMTKDPNSVEAQAYGRRRPPGQQLLQSFQRYGRPNRGVYPSY